MHKLSLIKQQVLSEKYNFIYNRLKRKNQTDSSEFNKINEMKLKNKHLRNSLYYRETSDSLSLVNICNTTQTLSLDDALNKSGGIGLYQYIILLNFSVALWLGGSVTYIMHIMQAQPKYLCFDKNSQSGIQYSCIPQDFCGKDNIGYQVDWTQRESIDNYIVQFGLECGSKLQIGMMGTSIYIGYTLSSIIFPRLADIYGRKILFLSVFPLHLIGTALILLVPSYIVIYVGLFLIGVAATIRTVIAYVYCLEFFETQKQNIAGTFMKSIDVTTPIIFSILYMTVTTNFKFYYMICLCLGIFVWLVSFIIPESPVFLLNQNRFSDAREVLSFINMINGNRNQLPKNYYFENEQAFINRKSCDELLESQRKQSKNSRFLLYYLKDSSIRRNLIVLCICWGVSCYGYQLILYYLKYIPGNIYLNTIYSSTADVLGYFITGVLIQLYASKSKFLLQISFLIAAISGLFLIVFTNINPALSTYMIFGCKFGVSATYNILTVININIFPMDFKTTSFGICNFFARISSIVAPLSAELTFPFPLILFCGTTFSAAFSTIILSDSKPSTEKHNHLTQSLLSQDKPKDSIVENKTFVGGYFGDIDSLSLLATVDRNDKNDCTFDESKTLYNLSPIRQ